MSELLPCPFCDGAVHLINAEVWHIVREGYVSCPLASIGVVAERWNCRSTLLPDRAVGFRTRHSIATGTYPGTFAGFIARESTLQPEQARGETNVAPEDTARPKDERNPVSEGDYGEHANPTYSGQVPASAAPNYDEATIGARNSAPQAEGEQVKRFDNDGYMCGRGVAPKFVLSADYDALAAKLAERERERDAVHTAIKIIRQRQIEAESRAAAAEKDARRYRFLRRDKNYALSIPFEFDKDNLDECIDAAIDAATGEGK